MRCTSSVTRRSLAALSPRSALARKKSHSALATCSLVNGGPSGPGVSTLNTHRRRIAATPAIKARQSAQCCSPEVGHTDHSRPDPPGTRFAALLTQPDQRQKRHELIKPAQCENPEGPRSSPQQQQAASPPYGTQRRNRSRHHPWGIRWARPDDAVVQWTLMTRRGGAAAASSGQGAALDPEAASEGE
jgi:hypothetical protein